MNTPVSFLDDFSSLISCWSVFANLFIIALCDLLNIIILFIYLFIYLFVV